MSEHTNASTPPDRVSGPAASPAHDSLRALLDPAIDPLFAARSPGATDGPWQWHLPFLAWLMLAARPAVLVDLCAGSEDAYVTCCDEVARSSLPTQCHAVRPASESPFSEDARDSLSVVSRREDRRHGSFSRLIDATIADAAGWFADGTIDVLIIDLERDQGWNEASGAHRRARWLPKLSPRSLLVVHGTVPAGVKSVGESWRSLSDAYQVFEFRHGRGLAVVSAGTAIPAGVRTLFGLRDDSTDAVRLRERMALFGERWRADERVQATEGRQEQLISIHRDELAQAQSALRRLSVAHDRLRDELAHSKADRYRLEQTSQRSLADRETDRQLRFRHRVEDDARSDERATAVVEQIAARLDRGLSDSRTELLAASSRSEAERADASRALADALATAADLRTSLTQAEHALHTQQSALRALQDSTSWRMTQPLRALRRALARTAPSQETPTLLPAQPITLPLPDQKPGLPDAPSEGIAAVSPLIQAPAPAVAVDATPEPPPADVALPETGPFPAAEPIDSAPVAAGAWRPIRRILFVAGEPGTPGAAYRTQRNAAACRAAGYDADTVDIAGVNPDNLAAADLVVLWRAGFSGHVQTMLELAAQARTRVAFDVDDLIVQPSLAVAEIIDGIRTTFVTEAESRAYFQSMQRTMLNCDLCTTTTRELAAAMGQQHPMVHVLPNAFDEAVERASRRAVRLRGERAEDGLVRLGYAGGTRTHQKDFAAIVPSLVAVLSQRAQARLVLFRDPRSGEGLVLVEEFPELVPLAHRIEWRDLVPLAELPSELARFDISLCPLEADNPFCEAKSELKYFESALANVCLVATPTGPFRRAVQDGVTGFLPTDAAGWTDTLLCLIDDAGLRRRVARAAGHDVLWRFGPRRQAELWALLLAEISGGVSGARAADLALRRGDHPPAGLPEVPDGVVLFSHDRLGEARVTVGMTSYNYESYIMEALDSVVAQTLEHLDLVVVDDGSRDGSIPLLLDWAERNRTRFNRLRILRTATNAGLGGARNLMVDQAETPWIMVLDSDNRLAPEACETLLRAVETDGMAAFAYPRIRQFGGADTVMGADDFQPARLAAGNYIDAMALVAKWAWAAAGGYYVRRDAMGWEDFSLWCRLVELGLHGVPVAEELGFYRVHNASMVNAITEQSDNKRAMVSFVEQRHRWLRLRMRAVRKRLERPAVS